MDLFQGAQKPFGIVLGWPVKDIEVLREDRSAFEDLLEAAGAAALERSGAILDRWISAAEEL
jgi:hypothetical protein